MLRNGYSLGVTLLGCILSFVGLDRSVAAETCRDLLKLPLTGENRPLEFKEFRLRTYGDYTQPALVMIHGHGSVLESFDHVGPELASRAFVITYDQRGHGKSSARGDRYDPPQLAADLKSLLDHLKIPSAHILGHSYGARTAIQFVASYPSMARSLIVEDEDGFSHGYVNRDSVLKRFRRLQKLDVMNRQFDSPETLYSEMWRHYRLFDLLDFLRWNAVKTPDGWALQNRPDTYYLSEKMIGALSLNPLLWAIDAPSLILVAKKSQSGISAEGLRMFQERLKNPKIVQFPTTEHRIHTTNPEEFLKVVNGFLDERENR